MGQIPGHKSERSTTKIDSWLAMGKFQDSSLSKSKNKLYLGFLTVFDCFRMLIKKKNEIPITSHELIYILYNFAAPANKFYPDQTFKYPLRFEIVNLFFTGSQHGAYDTNIL